MKKLWGYALLTVPILLSLSPRNQAQDQSDTSITLTITNQQKVIQLPLVPAQQFKLLSTPDLALPFQPAASGAISGYEWRDALRSAYEFYRLQIEPVNSNALVSASLLNRIAYGPTPDDLERLAQIGPQAYINEQISPWRIDESLPLDDLKTQPADWQYVTVTGKASSSILYIYLSVPGDAYIDELKLVSGSVAGVGTSRLQNADFDDYVSFTNTWTVSTNLTLSEISTTVTHSGTGSLHLVADSPGYSQDSSIYQVISPGLTTGSTYTLSYWWKPGTNSPSGLVVRLSNSGITSMSDSDFTRLQWGMSTLEDFRSWFTQRAIISRRQLLEVLLQFLENHFVTQWSKTQDYLAPLYGNDFQRADRYGARMEFMENKRWREALLNPQCTFYDLLKISAESPAMIIYLDTVTSRGDAKNIANENYARELLELFTFGVDNGYDQNDITVSSRAWTGWRIHVLHPTNEFNPLAPLTPLRVPGASQSDTKAPFVTGLWSFSYEPGRHNNTAKTIFPNKTVPSRFGPPYAGRNYQIVLPVRTGTPNGGTNGIADGYEYIAHLADQPFTQEFISVKLCRLLVHDDFMHGVYDYTDPNLSREGKLVHDCMMAWEKSTPKGQIWKVIEVILNSDLFRTQAGAMQKVKTPLEFTLSAIRSLRTQAGDGTYTSTGASISTPLKNMGRMALFNRDAPDGYPESGPAWISAGTLAERLRFVQAFLIKSGSTGRTDAGSNVCDPVKLLKTKLPSASWNNAGAVADYFLMILFPAEGKANMDQYRARAIQFLNTADDGKTASAFSGLVNTGTTYDTRVRGMVGMLMTLQRFQEQ